MVQSFRIHNGKLDVWEEKFPNGFNFYDNNSYLKLKTLKKSFNLIKEDF